MKFQQFYVHVMLHKIEMRLLTKLNDNTIFQQDKLIQLHFFLVL